MSMPLGISDNSTVYHHAVLPGRFVIRMPSPDEPELDETVGDGVGEIVGVGVYGVVGLGVESEPDPVPELDAAS